MKNPRIIRKVTKVAMDGGPKVAADRKAHVRMERVKAQQHRICRNRECKEWILPGKEFAMVYDRDIVKSFGYYKTFQEARAFHFECVPPNAKKLVRFFRK